jgi:hypothetical protein
VVDGSYVPSDRDTVASTPSDDQDSISVDITGGVDNHEFEEYNDGTASNPSAHSLSSTVVRPAAAEDEGIGSTAGKHCAAHRHAKIRPDLAERPQAIDVTTETVSPYRHAISIHHHIVSKRRTNDSSTSVDVYSPAPLWDEEMPPSPAASPTVAPTVEAIRRQKLATSAALTAASGKLSKAKKVHTFWLVQ